MKAIRNSIFEQSRKEYYQKAHLDRRMSNIERIEDAAKVLKIVEILRTHLIEFNQQIRKNGLKVELTSLQNIKKLIISLKPLNIHGTMSNKIWAEISVLLDLLFEALRKNRCLLVQGQIDKILRIVSKVFKGSTRVLFTGEKMTALRYLVGQFSDRNTRKATSALKLFISIVDNDAQLVRAMFQNSKKSESILKNSFSQLFLATIKGIDSGLMTNRTVAKLLLKLSSIICGECKNMDEILLELLKMTDRVLKVHPYYASPNKKIGKITLQILKTGIISCGGAIFCSKSIKQFFGRQNIHQILLSYFLKSENKFEKSEVGRMIFNIIRMGNRLLCLDSSKRQEFGECVKLLYSSGFEELQETALGLVREVEKLSTSHLPGQFLNSLTSESNQCQSSDMEVERASLEQELETEHTNSGNRCRNQMMKFGELNFENQDSILF